MEKVTEVKGVAMMIAKIEPKTQTNKTKKIHLRLLNQSKPSKNFPLKHIFTANFNA